MARGTSPRRLSTAAALVVAVLLFAIAPRPAGARAQPGGLNQAQTQALAYQAYEYGIPLMEFLRQARQQTSVTVANAHSDAPINQLGSARSLATAADQVIVQPNNDTLYTMGHLDLAGGALVLHCRPSPGVVTTRLSSSIRTPTCSTTWERGPRGTKPATS